LSILRSTVRKREKVCVCERERVQKATAWSYHRSSILITTPQHQHSRLIVSDCQAEGNDIRRLSPLHTHIYIYIHINRPPRLLARNSITPDNRIGKATTAIYRIPTTVPFPHRRRCCDPIPIAHCLSTHTHTAPHQSPWTTKL
jgi:hypothetical protein